MFMNPFSFQVHSLYVLTVPLWIAVHITVTNNGLEHIPRDHIKLEIWADWEEKHKKKFEGSSFEYVLEISEKVKFSDLWSLTRWRCFSMEHLAKCFYPIHLPSLTIIGKMSLKIFLLSRNSRSHIFLMIVYLWGRLKPKQGRHFSSQQE